MQSPQYLHGASDGIMLVKNYIYYSCARQNPTQSAHFGALDLHGPWRPGRGKNAAGRTHVQIQWCNRDVSRAPALHYGSDFSERNCSIQKNNGTLGHATHSNFIWWPGHCICSECTKNPNVCNRAVLQPFHFSRSLISDISTVHSE